MARRRIKNIRVGGCSVSIHKDSEWNEFIVTTKVSPSTAGVLQARRMSGTYHTSDKHDARSTAASLIRRLRKARVC